jgi:hypothetical protein
VIQDLRVVERIIGEDDALDSGLARITLPWEKIFARFTIRRDQDEKLALWAAPLGTPDPEACAFLSQWVHVRELSEPADHLWPCGCLPNEMDAHRGGCPLYPWGREDGR